MKISILSDFHFGFSPRLEIEEDSFENAEEAMSKALDSDLILIAGDIFDSRLPKTSTWAKAIKILVRPLLKEKTLNFVECSKELKEISQRTLNHLPVVAIHGTHERRGKGEINAIEALENAGILIHLHCQTIVFEKDGIRVALHGMSGVPERFAKDVLYSWDPKPIPNCFNILVLHQSIDPFVYSPLEPPSLSLSNLPKGFDLIVDGHVHIHGIEKVNESILVIPGSTIVTQFEKNESETEKGFVKVEIGETTKIDFIPLETNRKFFYEEVKLESNLPAREQIEKKINDIVYMRNLQKPPLIKLRIIGKEIEILDQELRDIERKYSGKAFVSFVKELEAPEITQKLEFLRNLREQKLSVEEIGLEVLRKNLEELSFNSTFDYDHAFKLLSEGEVERVFDILLGEQVTLTQALKKSLEEKQKGLEKWVNK
jgi:DNA repair exonuclease SbcCD nuclease subunit